MSKSSRAETNHHHTLWYTLTYTKIELKLLLPGIELAETWPYHNDEQRCHCCINWASDCALSHLSSSKRQYHCPMTEFLDSIVSKFILCNFISMVTFHEICESDLSAVSCIEPFKLFAYLQNIFLCDLAHLLELVYYKFGFTARKHVGVRKV